MISLRQFAVLAILSVTIVETFSISAVGPVLTQPLSIVAPNFDRGNLYVELEHGKAPPNRDRVDVESRQPRLRNHRRSRRSTEFSSDELIAILDKHNELRGQVSPEASNMEIMSWDDDLATMAQQWSDSCIFEHGNPDNISPYDPLGQNLWLGSAGNTAPNGVGAVQAWYNEVQYYDFDTRDCSHVCGHYTQVVWDSSHALGCGRAYCATATSDTKNYTNVYIITCNYGPAGNYQGADPYETGSSCTQCESGSALCYNNLCHTCSLDEEGCECRASCENCGTLTENCTCACQDGWYGTDCASACEDTHQYCWQSPGWPGPQYCDLSAAIPKGCPYMCGLCNLADPDFICEETSSSSPQATSADLDSTTSSSTQPTVSLGNVIIEETSSSSPQATSADLDSTTSSSTQPSVSLEETSSSSPQATSVALDSATSSSIQPSVSQSCGDDAGDVACSAISCQNGGTLTEATCSCTCTDEYQGGQCDHVKAEVQYGVEIKLETTLEMWSSIEDTLLRVVAEIVTDWCNDNFLTCCPNQGTKTSNETLAYLNATDVSVASGYPVDSTGTDDTATTTITVMVLVTPPLSTELCDAGSATSRRRRHAAASLVADGDSAAFLDATLGRVRRASDIEATYLDQSALYDAITENRFVLEDQLNVTITDIAMGEVEDSSSSSSAAASLSVAAIAGIAVVSVIIVVFVVALVSILIYKSNRSTKVRDVSKNDTKGF